jgi:D-proline reductase (dithiol) PrdB
VPVLARTLEAAGLATIMVTNMPFWADKVGAPRTLAVEFPFGHTLGQPHDVVQQMRVLCQALNVLETVESPGVIVHSQETWSVSEKEALEDWQPEELSPVIQVMAPHVREMMRRRRRHKA